MSVLLVGKLPRVIASAEKGSVWQGLAQTIDAHCAQRSGRMPGASLRNFRREMNRCRRLAGKPAAVRVEPDAGSSRANRDWTNS
jgi:hypothetical protein